MLDKHSAHIAPIANRRMCANWRSRIIGLVIVLGCATRPVLAQHKLVSLSLDDPAYEMFDAMDAAGCSKARI